MSRSSAVLDRTATLIVGLVLIAVGAAAIIWNTTWIDGIPESITAPGPATAARSWWWPWAVTAVGIVAVLLGLRWLASHSRARRVHTIPLAGSGRNGALSADLGALAGAAADRLALSPSVHSAKATAIIDRGRRTVDITVTAESVDDVATAADAADRVCCQAISMIGDDTVATRTRIRVNTKRDHGRRVV